MWPKQATLILPGGDCEVGWIVVEEEISVLGHVTCHVDFDAFCLFLRCATNSRIKTLVSTKWQSAVAQKGGSVAGDQFRHRAFPEDMFRAFNAHTFPCFQRVLLPPPLAACTCIAMILNQCKSRDNRDVRIAPDPTVLGLQYRRGSKIKMKQYKFITSDVLYITSSYPFPYFNFSSAKL